MHFLVFGARVVLLDFESDFTKIAAEPERTLSGLCPHRERGIWRYSAAIGAQPGRCVYDGAGAPLTTSQRGKSSLFHAYSRSGRLFLELSSSVYRQYHSLSGQNSRDTNSLSRGN